jgi:subtilisin family serine protease
VKVLNSTGSGLEADLAFGILYCADHGASVISMSLGTPVNELAVQRAVKDAYARGVVLVAASGNSGNCNCTQYPAAYPEVISVAGTTPTGFPAGADVDVAAPAVAIVSTTIGGAYRASNGTSQATPFVSAAAASLRDAHPTWSPAEIQAKLQSSARDVGPLGRDDFVGWGILDIRAALA